MQPQRERTNNCSTAQQRLPWVSTVDSHTNSTNSSCNGTEVDHADFNPPSVEMEERDHASSPEVTSKTGVGSAEAGGAPCEHLSLRAENDGEEDEEFHDTSDQLSPCPPAEPMVSRRVSIHC